LRLQERTDRAATLLILGQTFGSVCAKHRGVQKSDRSTQEAVERVGPSACRFSVRSTLVVRIAITVLSTLWRRGPSARRVCPGGRASLRAMVCRAMQAVYSMMAAAQGFSSEERSEFVPGSVFGAHSPPESFPSQPGADANGAAPAEGTDASTANASASPAADGESQPADLSEWTVMVAWLHFVGPGRVYGVLCVLYP